MINDKVYIGITSQKPERRWGHNGHGYKECPHFWHAIKKYGWNNFKHEILFSHLSHDEACAMEIKLIKELHANNPVFGYNISKGGDWFDSEYMSKLWKDSNYKAFASEQMRQAWKDPEKRKRRSDMTKKRWQNEDFKQKAQRAVLEACKSSVMCVETNEVFDSIKDAERVYGVDHANICRAIRTGYRCGGFHWKYYDKQLDDVS